MSNPAWTRVIRSRPGIATTTVVAFIAVGTYVATGGFGDPDTANPVVRIAAVASPVDGTETLTAVCIDTGGCASVTFKLDGDDLSTDSSSPFTYDWDTTTAPYLGVGYTNLSVRNGWSFNADLGLVGHGSGARLAS